MKKKNAKISVIVPVYNKEPYLKECIESILGQTYENLELILVDDESTDKSAAICDRYGQSDERVVVLHQKNGGPTAACVAGMRAATGQYYLFVDSDDYVERDMLAKMSECLKNIPGEVVCCDHILEKQKTTRPVRSAAAPGEYTGDQLVREIKMKLIGREQKIFSLSRCMKLCEKSVFQGNEPYYDYDIRFGDDSHLMYPAMLNSTRVVIMENAFFYHYRYVEGSIIHRYDDGIYESVEKLIASLSKAAADKQVPEGRQAVDREHCYMLLYVLKNELRSPYKNYKAKIRDIFGSAGVQELIRSTPLSVRERSHALLYLGIQYPDSGFISILRWILKLYDR
ncbi:MAG: glycosyltransferase [Clostridiales bacterium]|nr:glycosyltransferase [Clostridiales bacterium]